MCSFRLAQLPQPTPQPATGCAPLHALTLAIAGALCNPLQLTDLLGGCCSPRCPNIVHTWQAGWASVQQLDGTSLAPGQTVNASIAAASAVTSLAVAAGLRVAPSWVPDAEAVFVGYRTRTGGDAELWEGAAQRVHIYTSLADGTNGPQVTTWRASLAAGENRLGMAGVAWVGSRARTSEGWPGCMCT